MGGDGTQYVTLGPKHNPCYASKACTGKGTQAQLENYFDSVWSIARTVTGTKYSEAISSTLAILYGKQPEDR